MTRDSFIFYRSYWEAMANLDERTIGKCMKAVAAYALDGKEDKTAGVVGMLMTLIKPQIDANNRKYANGCKGATFGALGGRPKKNEKTPREPHNNPNKTPNDNVNENENASAYAGVYASLEVCAERAKANSSLRDRAVAAGVTDFEASVDEFAGYLAAVGDKVVNIRDFAARYLANVSKRVKPSAVVAILTAKEIEAAAALFPRANEAAKSLLEKHVLPVLKGRHGDSALDRLAEYAKQTQSVAEVWSRLKGGEL